MKSIISNIGAIDKDKAQILVLISGTNTVTATKDGITKVAYGYSDEYIFK